MSQSMSFSLRHVRIFWMLAILLMAGGQLLHAHEELGAAIQEHVHCSHDAATDDCSADTTCCHLHSSGATVSTEVTLLAATQTVSRYLSILDETCLDGPRGDIEYPPQLS